MAGTDIAVKKYVVRLSAEEREQLQALIRKGKSPAKRLLKARILLKADVSDAGEGWVVIARSSRRSIPAPRWPTGCASNWWKRALRRILSRKPPGASAGAGDLRRREAGSQADRPGVLQAAEGTRALDLAAARTRSWNSASSSVRATGTIGRALEKNSLKPHRRQCWVIPPKANSGFVAAMEDVNWPSTRGPMIPTARWSAWMRAQSSSLPRRACRSR